MKKEWDLIAYFQDMDDKPEIDSEIFKYNSFCKESISALFHESDIEDAEFGIDARQVVNTILMGLNPREKKTLELRFFEDCTYRQIADMYDLSVERVRQIEFRALRKCRYWIAHKGDHFKPNNFDMVKKIYMGKTYFIREITNKNSCTNG